MSVFKYPISAKKISLRTEENALSYSLLEAEDEIGLIQGIRPESKEEWHFAQALWQLKIPFYYQVEVLGGKLVRGGQVVDFLLEIPYLQPAQVFGEYWHENEMSDEENLNLKILEQIFERPVLVFWAEELVSKQEAINAIREKIAT